MPDDTPGVSRNRSLAERPQALRKQTIRSAEIFFSKLSSYSELRPEEMLPGFARLSEVLRTSYRKENAIFLMSHESGSAEQYKERRSGA